jgi:poly-gamma-glutamate synthesis protein (capsule biosynthesis protein)
MLSFSSRILGIPSSIRADMLGRSWHDAPDCPRFDDLRLLELAYLDLDGAVQTGELIVATSIADEVCTIFARLFEVRFPIASMVRVDAFDGDDGRSMWANNTSAFNFRRIAGTDQLSHHALGLAIDLNPVQNPWLRDERIDPAEGRRYLDRDDVRPGMIVRPGPVVEAFARHGWFWGGDFEGMRDYHHFSKLGR